MYPSIVSLHVLFSYSHFKPIPVYIFALPIFSDIVIFPGLWLSYLHVVSQHTLRRNHLQPKKLDRSPFVST